MIETIVPNKRAIDEYTRLEFRQVFIQFYTRYCHLSNLRNLFIWNVEYWLHDNFGCSHYLIINFIVNSTTFMYTFAPSSGCLTGRKVCFYVINVSSVLSWTEPEEGSKTYKNAVLDRVKSLQSWGLQVDKLWQQELVRKRYLKGTCEPGTLWLKEQYLCSRTEPILANYFWRKCETGEY